MGVRVSVESADFAEAYMLTRPERGELVVAVFETESQYFVAEVM